MGDAADFHTEQGFETLGLHRACRCGDLGGPCPHCEETMNTDDEPDQPTTAVAVRQPRPGLALITADALQQEAEQRKLLGEYVKGQMVNDVDYGVIPGTKKRTLLKPGAEKLTQLFRCTPRYTMEDKKEDWESGLFYYRFKCEVVTQGDDVVVAEGVGSCSTYEKKYRERAGGRVCPDCGKDTIKKSKYPDRATPDDPPGWYCFAKIGGCGVNYRHDDDRITGQVEAAQKNPDILDCVNTVLKMAKKRALVDAAISLGRCSDLFTQDVEETRGGDRPASGAAGREAPAHDFCGEACEALDAAESIGELAQRWVLIERDRKRFTCQQWDRIIAAHDKAKGRLAPTKANDKPRIAQLAEKAVASKPPRDAKELADRLKFLIPEMGKLVADFSEGDVRTMIENEIVDLPDRWTVERLTDAQAKAAWVVVKTWLEAEARTHAAK